MNKDLLLDLLVKNAVEQADNYYSSLQQRSLEEALCELNNREKVALPPSLPKTPRQMIRSLQQHFANDVTQISLVLSHYFPEDYFFYRVSKLEPEIFAGFEFFSDIVPQFNFPFSKVGKAGFNRYLQLNKALLEYARIIWPKSKKPQRKLAYFLYQGLGSLFLEKNDYRQYWVVSGSEDKSFDYLDRRGKKVTWSGRKAMRPGDLVFMYRTAPRKAITNILRVKNEPYFEPVGAWDGFWVDLEKLAAIEDISITEMREDSIIGKWGTVRKNFRGTVTEPIPPIVYNQLLKRVPEVIRVEHGLEPEVITTLPPEDLGLLQPPTIPTPQFLGWLTSEAEFEEKVIEPLLKQLGFICEAQHPCDFYMGKQTYAGRVDFFVRDQQGPLTLFENKFHILKDEDLKPAVEQAKSYALQLGLSSFVVASPEGMWLYALERNKEALIEPVPANQMTNQQQEEEFKNLLLKLR